MLLCYTIIFIFIPHYLKIANSWYQFENFNQLSLLVFRFMKRTEILITTLTIISFESWHFYNVYGQDRGYKIMTRFILHSSISLDIGDTKVLHYTIDIYSILHWLIFYYIQHDSSSFDRLNNFISENNSWFTQFHGNLVWIAKWFSHHLIELVQFDYTQYHS